MKISVEHFLQEIYGLTEIDIMDDDTISKEINNGTMYKIHTTIVYFRGPVFLLESLYMNQKLVMPETFFENELKRSTSFNVCSTDIWEETMITRARINVTCLYVKFDSKLEAMKFKLSC